MIAVTTPTLEGAPIKRYYGIVSGETFAGVNLFKDIGAGFSVVGPRTMKRNWPRPRKLRSTRCASARRRWARTR